MGAFSMVNLTKEHLGFEIGPIRPPSEAESLLLRVTRNCPWNKCKFCGLYKGKNFSIRPKEHVLKDIDLVKQCIDTFKEMIEVDLSERQTMIKQLRDDLGQNADYAYNSAINWYRTGMESVFLQDGNSMIIKPDDMIDILTYIRKQFPQVNRITSYGRSKNIARISDEDLKRMADSGLNRIHIGMETADNKVLELINKGVDKQTQIEAGQKVKRAGIELSEYFMPGIGGNEYSRQNALETADALNQINPDFIRIRTTVVTDNAPLKEDYVKGIFTRPNGEKMVEELLLMIENLEGITSTIKSDHIVNLIPEVEGKLPRDKEKMISALRWFLSLDEEERIIFKVGRRTSLMSLMADLYDPFKRTRVENIIETNNITKENVDGIVDEAMNRFI